MSTLQNITEETLTGAIDAATHQVVLLAPGITEGLAETLGRAWSRLDPDHVSVILDVDPEVCRMGYGTEKGLIAIQEIAKSHGQLIAHQPGVRLSVLVTDSQTLVFSPTPLLIEGGSKEPNRPNGIILRSPPPELTAELGAGPDGQATREIGIKKIEQKDVEAVSEDLKENPPLKFDVARAMRVFNSQIEFVELELEGVYLSRHTVTIPPTLLGFAKQDPATRNKLTSNYKLLEKGEKIGKGVSEADILDERKRITGKYLVSVDRYKTMILRANKAGFLVEVEGLRKLIETFKTTVELNLAAHFDKTAKKLTSVLFPAVAKAPLEAWTSFLGPSPKPAEIRQALHEELLTSFGTVQSFVGSMKVRSEFKGVTYEYLQDPEFLASASRAFHKDNLFREFDAVEGSNPAPVKQLV